MEPSTKPRDVALGCAAGQPLSDLRRALAERPEAFEFFQAVRLLEANCAGCAPVGLSSSPGEEAVHFTQVPSMGFPPTDLSGCDVPGDGRSPAQLSVHLLGLLGPHGPLPNSLTSYVVQRCLRRDYALRDFVNLFNHRLLSFFYRAWAMANKAVDQDPPSKTGGSASLDDVAGGHRFRFYSSSLVGGLHDEASLRDQTLEDAILYFSGRFSFPTPNAEGLEAILEDFFDLQDAVKVEQFVPRWLPIPIANQWSLDSSAPPAKLGEDTVAGSHILDHDSTFRIVLGPLSYDDYERLLPPDPEGAPDAGRAFRRLGALVRRYTKGQFFWEVQYILKGGEVPAWNLDGTRRLGYDVWVRKEKEPDNDAADLVIEPERCPLPGD